MLSPSGKEDPDGKHLTKKGCGHRCLVLMAHSEELWGLKEGLGGEIPGVFVCSQLEPWAAQGLFTSSVYV